MEVLRKTKQVRIGRDDSGETEHGKSIELVVKVITSRREKDKNKEKEVKRGIVRQSYTKCLYLV